ncbi:MAG: carbohydrate kinase family protein [SAR324 cluster bacterium]|nr:carbohydrate kinase family protein [SAR324 cluster bacterium]
MKPTVLCIGGANLDRKLRLSEPLRMGTSNPVTSEVSPGGVARNVAENLARLGCKVGLLSTFSDDLEGNWLLDHLNSAGVDVSPSLIVPGRKSGSYTALQDAEGEMLLAMADMELADSMSVGHLQKSWNALGIPDAVFLDTNFPEPVLNWVIEQCLQGGLELHVDPVSVPKSRKLPNSLKGIHTLQPNLDELESLTGKSLSKREDRMDACQSLLDQGVKKIILSLGSEGLQFVSRKHQFMLPAMIVKARDVTGAGDALCAGVLWGNLKGGSDQMAAQAGFRMAAKTMECDSSVWPDLKPEFLEPLLENQKIQNDC